MYRIFGHYIPKMLLVMGFAETLIYLFSVYLVLVIWGTFIDSQISISSGYTFLGALLFSSTMLVAMIAMGLYHRNSRENSAIIWLRLVLSFGLGIILLMLLNRVTQLHSLDIHLNIYALACAFLIISICRFAYFQNTNILNKHKTLVLGTGESAQQLEYMRRRTDNPGIEIIGFANTEGSSECYVSENRVIKLNEPLAAIVNRNGVKEIVVAMEDRRQNLYLHEILDCKMRGINVIDISTFLERQLGKISLETLHPSTVIFSDGFSKAVKSTYKRSMDFILSTLMLVIVSPVMLITAIAIFIESRGRGSIVYRQQRVGLHGKIIKVLKFRSMKEDAEINGREVWAKDDDDRITRIGSIIRKMRIDELPQLINVLKGDMSIVGPRPERPKFVNSLAEQIPYYNLRHYVKPGITGWAQICYPYGSSTKDAREKLQYDLYYLKNYSAFLDLLIIVQTITVILWGKGAR